jgi:hypothetical protein
MRETRIKLQGGLLKELDLEQGSAFVRNDLKTEIGRPSGL